MGDRHPAPPLAARSAPSRAASFGAASLGAASLGAASLGAASLGAASLGAAFFGALRGIILCSALFAASAAGLAAQDATAAPASPAAEPSVSSGAASESSSDDDLFGEEMVTEAATTDAATAAPQADFLKYESVLVGGSFSGSTALGAIWNPAWDGSAKPFEPTDHSLKPSLSAALTLTAKPSTDFGVNVDIRTGFPFITATSVSVPDDPDTTIVEKTATIKTPNISVWSLYSKFSYKDSLYFSFGKQPLSWGVSKFFFQPADDIFALSAVDINDTKAEREGPLSLKAHVPVPLTMTNFYLYGGIPDMDDPKPRDARLAAKAEFNIGNTEFAGAGYYSYNDHPRALVMATTGTGDFNFFGEGVVKFGSDRTFIAKRAEPLVLSYGNPRAPSTITLDYEAKKSSAPFAIGTIGGFYTHSDPGISVSLQYYYNGEAQANSISRKDAITYYAEQAKASALKLLPETETEFAFDSLRWFAHYGAAAISFSDVGLDNLTIGSSVIVNLSDLSGLVIPSVSYQIFDYMTLKVSGGLNFGEEGDEFIAIDPSFKPSSSGKPAASLSVSLTLGSGAF